MPGLKTLSGATARHLIITFSPVVAKSSNSSHQSMDSTIPDAKREAGAQGFLPCLLNRERIIA
jgi:hypothetical protein